MAKLEVEIHLTIAVEEKDVPKVLKAAEEQGQGYGDPGKRELIRRLFIDGGIEAMMEATGDPTFNSYEVHHVKT